MSETPAIASITEFIESTGARLRIFDMGRRITKLTRDDFLRFERTELPYPYPLQQQAWFALLFQDREHDTEPFIWFLRLPLDEQGTLLQAARDDFMHRLLERVGENISASRAGSTLQAALQDNPYSFKPKEERMAVFHAKASLLFGQPVSRYFDHARRYFSGDLGWDQWGFVGYQGIAEIAARQGDREINQLLAEAIGKIPEKPLEALCHCLENEAIDHTITRALLERTEALLADRQSEPLVTAACIRAVACSRSQDLKRSLIAAVLEHPCSRSAEILAAISGRCWECLLDGDLRQPFLERLAENDQGQPFFNQCLGDLLYIPGMRAPLLAGIRDPQRSARLAAAIGALFQGLNH